MIVTCEVCKKFYDDEFRDTQCPHDTFSANDGHNNFKHHPRCAGRSLVYAVVSPPSLVTVMLENLHERINQVEDLLGDALDHLEGKQTSKEGIISNIKAYFDARKQAG